MSHGANQTKQRSSTHRRPETDHAMLALRVTDDGPFARTIAPPHRGRFAGFIPIRRLASGEVDNHEMARRVGNWSTLLAGEWEHAFSMGGAEHPAARTLLGVPDLLAQSAIRFGAEEPHAGFGLLNRAQLAALANQPDPRLAAYQISLMAGDSNSAVRNPWEDSEAGINLAVCAQAADIARQRLEGYYAASPASDEWKTEFRDAARQLRRISDYTQNGLQTDPAPRDLGTETLMLRCAEMDLGLRPGVFSQMQPNPAARATRLTFVESLSDHLGLNRGRATPFDPPLAEDQQWSGERIERWRRFDAGAPAGTTRRPPW